MPLNSFSFIILLPVLVIVLGIMQILGHNIEKRNGIYVTGNIQLVLLLAFSYYFMCRTDIYFGACIAIETGIAYTTGILIDRWKNKNKQFLRLIMFIGILSLLLMLLYFKYCNFFINGFRKFLGLDSISLNIILPLGISFYTFTALSYVIDIYWGRYKAEKNMICFALFLSFFPKAIAGPIVRGDVFLPQTKKYKGIKLENLEEGVQIFVFGLFKKVVLADRLGVFVDDVFFAPSAYNTFTVFWAVLSYTMQIYFDFSGYSDMAIGISKMVGFDFPPNFNIPYISRDIAEFWKRWHISLSSWLQDYIYIPLGGSRRSTLRTYLNLLLVMLLSGLWHGADFTFIIWGGIYGIATCINKAIKGISKNVPNILNVIGTFMAVSLLWVIFRAESMSNAKNVYKALFTFHGGIMQPYAWTFFSLILLIVATVAAYIRNKRKSNKIIDGFYPVMGLNCILTLTIFFTFLGITVVMGYFGNTAFIYGRF